MHAGVAARAHERDKVERLCRYVSRPPVAESRLSLTTNGEIRYRLKTPYRDGTRACPALSGTHVIFQPLELMAHIPVRHPAGALRSSKSAVLPICLGAPCSAGAAPACKPDSVLRCVRTKQSVSGTGHAGGAG